MFREHVEQIKLNR